MNYPATASMNDRPLVVLLEDDHGVRRSTQLLLKGRGFEVKAFASPEALLSDIQVTKATCLVADYRLSEVSIDGIAVLEALRRRGWAGPAMLVTAYSSPELMARAEAVGYDAVFDKPFKDHVLLNALSRIMSQQ